MKSLKDALQTLRVLHGVFCLTIVVFLLVYLLKPPQNEVSSTTVAAIAIVAIGDLFLGRRFRDFFITPALAALRKNLQDRSAINRWYVGNVLSFCFAEAIALLGLLLRLLGAEWKVAAPFFVVGFLVLLVYFPRLDSELTRQ